MGNRAVIAFESALSNENEQSIYLHWNGGRDSVEGFLKVAKELRIPGTEQGLIALAETIGTNFFNNHVESPTGMNVYLQEYKVADTNNFDNGTYIIDSEWNITQRLIMEGSEQSSFNSNELANYILARVSGMSEEDAEKFSEGTTEVKLPENIEQVREVFASHLEPAKLPENIEQVREVFASHLEPAKMTHEVIVEVLGQSYSTLFSSFGVAKSFAMEAMDIEGFEGMSVQVV